MEPVEHTFLLKLMQISVAFCIGYSFSRLTRFGIEQICRRVEEPENFNKKQFRKQARKANLFSSTSQFKNLITASPFLLHRAVCGFVKKIFMKKSEIMKREKLFSSDPRPRNRRSRTKEREKKKPRVGLKQK